MNYEEKYNEMLEWARKKKARLNGVPIEEVLPELAESEDEKIRKAIIRIIKNSNVFDINVSHERMFAYLEKQAEQKQEKHLLGSHPRKI